MFGRDCHVILQLDLIIGSAPPIAAVDMNVKIPLEIRVFEIPRHISYSRGPIETTEIR